MKNKNTNKNKKFYIVRGENSGVFFGTIKKRKGREVLMNNTRRLWYWAGACSLSQLAEDGTALPESCNFSVPVTEMIVLDAVEILRCSKTAVNSIQGVLEWKF